MITDEKDLQGAPQTDMEKVYKHSPVRPAEGDLVEGVVIGEDKMALYVDMKPFGTGIIYGREYLNAKDIIKKTNVGDTITAKVVEQETEEGYIGLSLREARQALIWGEADAAIKSKAVFDLPVKDANKGGLLIEWKGLIGFLPASQLKSEHYPRISDGDKDKILIELKKLIGEKISVSIIAASPKEGKLIFSEKSSTQKEKAGLVEKYNVGDTLDGEVTGAVDFGVFVKIEEGLEGLVHISEIDWSLVEDPRKLFKVGEKVKVKVIEVKDGKISLSIKALKENPWTTAADRYKKGQEVRGVVIKHNKHGALVSIEDGVAGLVHVSDFGTEDELRKALELGKTYAFKINIFEPSTQRMTLTFKREEKK
ncbi:MAG: S1 RNA-binding domain-containing protein [Candidatus Paceibacterota bacterium]|jgi:small subunit ribosomal protein S1